MAPKIGNTSFPSNLPPISVGQPSSSSSPSQAGTPPATPSRFFSSVLQTPQTSKAAALPQHHGSFVDRVVLTKAQIDLIKPKLTWNQERKLKRHGHLGINRFGDSIRTAVANIKSLTDLSAAQEALRTAPHEQRWFTSTTCRSYSNGRGLFKTGTPVSGAERRRLIDAENSSNDAKVLAPAMARLKRSDKETTAIYIDTAVPGTETFDRKFLSNGTDMLLTEAGDEDTLDNLAPLEKLKILFVATYKGRDPQNKKDLLKCFNYTYEIICEHCVPPSDSPADSDLYSRKIGRGLGTVIAALSQFIRDDHAKWNDRASLVKDLSGLALAGAGSAAPGGAAAAFALGGLIVGRAVDHFLKSSLDETFPDEISGLLELKASVHRKNVSEVQRQAENAAALAFASTLGATLRGLPSRG